MRDLPILIWGPPRDQGGYRIALEDDCEASYTPNSMPQDVPYTYPLGDCYEITVRHTSVAFADALAMTTALPELSAVFRALEIGDLTTFRSARAVRLKPYEGLVLHFDPVWSPDSARLLYAVWSNGEIRFEVLEASSDVVTRLDALEGYMAVPPVWSGDSRFVAYASPDMVKFYDVQTRTTRTFRPTPDPAARARTMLEFEGTRLYFAFDVNYFGGEEAYLYDASQGTLERVPAHTVRSSGGAPRDQEPYDSLRPVRSPDGKWIAMFTFVNGQRRVRIEALR